MGWWVGIVNGGGPLPLRLYHSLVLTLNSLLPLIRQVSKRGFHHSKCRKGAGETCNFAGSASLFLSHFHDVKTSQILLAYILPICMILQYAIKFSHIDLSLSMCMIDVRLWLWIVHIGWLQADDGKGARRFYLPPKKKKKKSLLCHFFFFFPFN
jgi:hypothetical protein